jgi:hypothetical protein
MFSEMFEGGKVNGAGKEGGGGGSGMTLGRKGRKGWKSRVQDGQGAGKTEGREERGRFVTLTCFRDSRVYGRSVV